MTVADLAHEAARRYVDALPLPDLRGSSWSRPGQPAIADYPPFVNDLARVLRTVLEAALVEHLTIPELKALGRFYATPEGEAVMGKLLALNEAMMPRLVAAADAWGRELEARVRALSSA